MATLQRAVDGVVESMQAQAQREPEPRLAGPLKADGNPLLAALRQILQATISEQVATLEVRLLDQIETRARGRDELTAAWGRKLDSFEAWGQKLDSVEAGTDRLAGALDEVRARVGAAADRAASRDDMTRLSIRMAEDGAKSDALGAQVGVITEALERLESVVVEAAARASAVVAPASGAELERLGRELQTASNASRDALLNELKEVRRALRDDVVRVVSATQLMHKAIDGLSAEVKKLSGTDASARLDSALERVGAKADSQRSQLEALVAEARQAGSQVGELAAELKHLDARMAARASDSNDALRAMSESLAGRTDVIQTELATLADQLRRKKNWFG